MIIYLRKNNENKIDRYLIIQRSKNIFFIDDIYICIIRGFEFNYRSMENLS